MQLRAQERRFYVVAKTTDQQVRLNQALQRLSGKLSEFGQASSQSHAKLVKRPWLFTSGAQFFDKPISFEERVDFVPRRAGRRRLSPA